MSEDDKKDLLISMLSDTILTKKKRSGEFGFCLQETTTKNEEMYLNTGFHKGFESGYLEAENKTNSLQSQNSRLSKENEELKESREKILSEIKSVIFSTNQISGFTWQEDIYRSIEEVFKAYRVGGESDAREK